MSGPVRAGDARRIARGLASNIAATAARFAAQFAVLPLLFAAWDAERVGIWLLIATLPAYLAHVGNGFAGAGGVAALAAAQRGDGDEARSLFRAAWRIATGTTALLACAFAFGGAALVLADPPVLEVARRADIAIAIGWLAAYVMLTGQFTLLDLPFRVAGRYPDHSLLAALAVLGDAAAVVIGLWLGDSYAALAGAMTINRLVILIVTFMIARRAAPLLLGASPPPSARGRLTDLVKPSLGLMLFPLILGLNLQGYALLIGFAFGPALLAAFIATRTLVRLLDVATGLTFTLQFYEFGYLDQDRTTVQRRMLATMTLLTLAVSLGFAALVMATGPSVQAWATDGETRFDFLVAGILLIAALLRALATNPVAMLAAANRTQAVSGPYAVASLVGLLAAGSLVLADAPLWAVVLPLVGAEAVQAIRAFGGAFTLTQTHPGAFRRTLLSRERLADLAALARKLPGLQRRPG